MWHDASHFQGRSRPDEGRPLGTFFLRRSVGLAGRGAGPFLARGRRPRHGKWQVHCPLSSFGTTPRSELWVSRLSALSHLMEPSDTKLGCLAILKVLPRNPRQDFIALRSLYRFQDV